MDRYDRDVKSQRKLGESGGSHRGPPKKGNGDSVVHLLVYQETKRAAALQVKECRARAFRPFSKHRYMLIERTFSQRLYEDIGSLV